VTRRAFAAYCRVGEVYLAQMSIERWEDDCNLVDDSATHLWVDGTTDISHASSMMSGSTDCPLAD